MFIRQKLISNRPYAYLVNTKWDKRSKKVRQKVSRYLGRIIFLERVKNTSFSDYYSVDISKYVADNDLKTILRDLIELEFYRHGFLRRSKYMMLNGSKAVDLENIEEVYAMNEGFMNKYTLRSILKYHDLLEEGTTRIPFKFAALFVNAGIDLDKALFIELYQKLFSENL